MRINEVPFRDIMGKILLVGYDRSSTIEQLFQLSANDSLDDVLSDKVSLK